MPPIRGTHGAFAGCLDTVTELIKAGETFGDVERAIDEFAGVTEDEKAALWLLAFARRDLPGHGRDVRSQPLTLVH